MGGTLEKRVGDFFSQSGDCVGFDSLGMHSQCRGNWCYAYETASDVRKGPNVYTYVIQNPWTYFDPLGLVSSSPKLDMTIGVLKALRTPVYMAYRTAFDNDNFTTEVANQAIKDSAAAKEVGAAGWVGVANRYNPGAMVANAMTGTDFVTGEELDLEARAENGTGAAMMVAPTIKGVVKGSGTLARGATANPGGASAKTISETAPKAPKPTPNFKKPTNPPSKPPADLPEGHTVREMPSTEQYPNGYWKQQNQHGQPVDPSTGKPPSNVSKAEARAQTHVELPPPESK